MISRLRDLRLTRRVAAFAGGVWDTFLRDNKVLPPVLAVLALFVFAWIVAGSFIGGGDDEPISSREDIAQSEGAQPPAPEVENPNVDSYAAYQSKDPFRQLFETEEATQPEDGGTGTPDPGTPDPTTPSASDDGASEDGFSDPGSTATGAPGAADDQYENGRAPRTDPTAPATGNQQDTTTPQPPATPARPGDDLFESGGDLAHPNGRGGGR